MSIRQHNNIKLFDLRGILIGAFELNQLTKLAAQIIGEHVANNSDTKNVWLIPFVCPEICHKIFVFFAFFHTFYPRIYGT